jgi:hypothetical protein
MKLHRSLAAAAATAAIVPAALNGAAAVAYADETAGKEDAQLPSGLVCEAIHRPRRGNAHDYGISASFWWHHAAFASDRLIVMNEAKVIERCLASVADLVDTWMISDTTEGTQQLIRSALGGIPGELLPRGPWF